MKIPSEFKQIIIEYMKLIHYDNFPKQWLWKSHWYSSCGLASTGKMAGFEFSTVKKIIKDESSTVGNLLVMLWLSLTCPLSVFSNKDKIFLNKDKIFLDKDQFCWNWWNILRLLSCWNWWNILKQRSNILEQRLNIL